MILNVDGPRGLSQEEILSVVGYSTMLEAFKIMNESKKECPVDTGLLRSTGRVDDAVIEGGSVRVDLGYYTNYAIFVHEDLTKHHVWPTKAKFLEDPINRAMPEFEQLVAKRAEHYIREGV